MILEEFLNKKICPTGVMTAWDETVLTTAYRLGDTDTLTSKTTELCAKAGIEAPTNLILE